MGDDLAARLREAIRDIPDFPQPGVLFRDVTTLLMRPLLLREAIDALWQPFAGERVSHIVALEARGFIFGGAMAVERGLPLVIMRKPGKLPAAVHAEEYELEYGNATLEVHADALGRTDRALVVDDVLATGGTAAAAGRLVARCGAELVGYTFLAELDFLNGRGKLEGTRVVSVLHYRD
jgi:adenine phosphoribosyltransferase